MRETKKSTILLAVLCAWMLALPASAQRLDLSSWSATTIPLPEHLDNGEWLLFDDNTNVIQTMNSSPTFFCNNVSQSHYAISGTLFVGTFEDDDMIGLAFGYQDPGHCYILDWKQEGQEADGSFREEGLIIRRMHGDPAEMVWADYWGQEVGAERFTILDTNLGPGRGWQEFTLYDFAVLFDAGSFFVSIHDGGTEIWSTVIDDGVYPSGQFAFYCFSQWSVVYTGISEPPVATERRSLSAVKALFR